MSGGPNTDPASVTPDEFYIRKNGAPLKRI
jgi:hypothetical protein